MHRLGGHHEHPIATGDPSVHDPDIGDDAAIGVVHGIEDQGPGAPLRISHRGGHLGHDGLEQFRHAGPGLGRDPQHRIRVAPDDAAQLGGVLLRLGGGQVDLVEHRDDREIVLQGKVEIREGLRLDPLGGVDEQDGALAGRQRAGHLVGEVDMPGGVDEVQHEVGARC